MFGLQSIQTQKFFLRSTYLKLLHSQRGGRAALAVYTLLSLVANIWLEQLSFLSAIEARIVFCACHTCLGSLRGPVAVDARIL